MVSTSEGTKTPAQLACRYPKGYALSNLAVHAFCSQKVDAGQVSVRGIEG